MSTPAAASPTETPADPLPGPTSRQPDAGGTSWTHTIRIAVVAALVVGVILLAFAWPSLTAKPRDLPVAVVGTAEQVAQVAAKSPPGVLDLRQARDRDDAIAMIQRREVYGALVLSPAPEILTASAAGAAPTQVLTQLAQQMQIQVQQATIAALQGALQSGATPAAAPAVPASVTVTDVVPLSSHDSMGVGLAIAGLPLALGGMVGGVLVSLTITGTRRRLGGVLAYGVVGGLVLAGILQGWFGVLQGAFLLNALAIGLGIAATAALIAGLHSLIGPAGIGVGAVITVLIGNPLSGTTQPKEFLLQPWGEVGQWFVPGASATLLRSLSYFPQASVAGPWLVLSGWFVLGVLLIGLGHRARRGAAVLRELPAVAA